MSGYFQSSKIRKARKAHKCYLCGMLIRKGESYRHTHGRGEFGFYDTKLHMTCDILVDRYCDATGESEWDNDNVLTWLSDTVCNECANGDDPDYYSYGDYEDCSFSFRQTPSCLTLLKYFGIGGDA